MFAHSGLPDAALPGDEAVPHRSAKLLCHRDTLYGNPQVLRSRRSACLIEREAPQRSRILKVAAPHAI
jgi:hypothetical protein